MEKNAAKNHRFLDFPFVRLQLRCKKVPHRIACTPIPAAAPAYRAKTFFSRAVQRKCFTSYILLYSAARRAAPIYHSLPENATRSRVPHLNAPMGTPRPHVSRHVSGRAPRRGRRPRRPVFRSLIAGCTRVLHVCLRWLYFFQQRQKRVAPESEMSPPRASAQNDTPPALPEGYRSSHDLKTCPC